MKLALLICLFGISYASTVSDILKRNEKEITLLHEFNNAFDLIEEYYEAFGIVEEESFSLLVSVIKSFERSGTDYLPHLKQRLDGADGILRKELEQCLQNLGLSFSRSHSEGLLDKDEVSILELRLNTMVDQLVESYKDPTKDVSPRFLDQIVGVVKDLENHDVDAFILLEDRVHYLSLAINAIKRLSVHHSDLQEGVVDNLVEYKKKIKQALMSVLDSIIEDAKNHKWPSLNLLGQFADLVKDAYTIKMDITDMVQERLAKISGRLGKLVMNIVNDIFKGFKVSVQESVAEELLEYKRKLRKQLMDLLDQIIEEAKNSYWPPLSLLGQFADLAKEAYTLKMDITDMVEDRMAKMGGRLADLVIKIVKDIFSKGFKETSVSLFSNEHEIQALIEKLEDLSQQIVDHVSKFEVITPKLLRETVDCIKQLKANDHSDWEDIFQEKMSGLDTFVKRRVLIIMNVIRKILDQDIII